MKFSDNLIGLVISGKKTTTRRVNDEKNITAGDILSLCRVDGAEFAKAGAVSVRETTFANLTKDDWNGHEKFSSEKEMYIAYSKYYGCTITPKDRVKIIKFELIS